MFGNVLFSIILAVFLWFNTHTQAINPEIFPKGDP